jgi:hypothetical protein
MKTIIHKSAAGIWSTKKEANQRKLRLVYQGNDKSADISMGLFSSIEDAKDRVFSKLNTHGGARENAGRKPKEPTKTMRVPVSMVEVVKKMIEEKRKP